MVLVDTPAWSEHGAIGVDDVGGALAAARHLLSLGHRDLLMLTMETPEAQDAGGAEEGRSVMGERMRGYKRALAEYQLELGPERVRQAPATFEGGEAAFLRACEDGLRPTGVLSMSDAAAAGARRALSAEGGGTGEHRLLETRLVVRRSTAPVRALAPTREDA